MASTPRKLFIMLVLVAPTTTASAQDNVPSTAAFGQLLRAAVLEGSPAVAARRAEVAAARALIAPAGASPAAVLAAELEEVPNGADVRNAGSIRIDLMTQIISGGRRQARRHMAEAQLMEATARLHLTERHVSARAGQLLTRAVASAAVVQLLSAEDSLLAEVDQALRARFAVGDARYVDVLRLRTERLRIQSERAWSMSDQRVSRNSLLALVESGPSAIELVNLVDSMLRLPSGLDEPLPEAPELDSLWMLSGTHTLAAALVTQAEAAARVHRAELRPEWSAGVGVQRFGDQVGGFQVGPTVGFTVSMPFTRAGSNRASLEALELSVESVLRQSDATNSAVRDEIAAARDRYESARVQLGAFDAALVIGAREESESALAAYRTGELSLLELLDFQRVLTRTEILRLQSRIMAADAYAEMMGATLDEGPGSSALLTLISGRPE